MLEYFGLKALIVAVLAIGGYALLCTSITDKLFGKKPEASIEMTGQDPPADTGKTSKIRFWCSKRIDFKIPL